MRIPARAVLLASVVGCVPLADPRLPQSVAAALAQNPMRSVESENLRLYFPEGRQEEARRFLTHVEGCVGYLRRAARVHNGVADQKMIVLLPELPYNNAFVAPGLLGYDTEAVIPTFNTIDEFSLEMGQPPDSAEIACHEITHYVHFQQIAGFAWFWNTTSGAVYTPQIGLDSWFDEGLAVYYETKLQPGTGRLAWPFWRGAFAAGYAGRRINGGDLHALQRDFHAGNNYLVGSQFVRFLADRYGEDKLWRLIEVQARSIFFPLWVNLRFWQVYDKTLSTLIDEFADEVDANLRPRDRPPGQRIVRSAGTSARYARAPNGTEALVTEDHDRPPRLEIYAPDGRLRVERNLTDVVPPRSLAIAAATRTSGLSFTADGRTLYFVAVDTGPTFQAARLLRYDVENDELTVAGGDINGTGGSISADGTRYLFARADGDHHDLAELDLRTQSVRVLAAQAHGAYVAHPRFSPDGTRVVALQFDGSRFRIALFDALSGKSLGALPTGDGPVHDPSWIDDNRVLYLASSATSAGFQVYVQDVHGEGRARVTDAPYLAFEPRAAGDGTLRFLNREGWGWTVDEVPLPQPLPVPAQPPAPPMSSGAPPTVLAPAPLPEADSGVAPDAPARAVDPSASTPPTPSAPPTGSPIAGAPPVENSPTPMPTDQGPSLPPLLDRPYSPLDHLFVPLLHGPTLQVIGRQAFLWGLAISGNDRLSLHRWTVAGYYQTAGGGAPSILAGYTNRQLAPLTLTLFASQMEAHDVAPAPVGRLELANSAFSLFRRDRRITADASRAFYGNPVIVGFALLETYQPLDSAVFLTTRRFAGPHLAASYTGAESTAYTGPRRLLAVGGELTAYPASWNTLGLGFVDGRAELDAVMPLPLLHRHSLSLGIRVRDLMGLRSDLPLLFVGGYSAAVLKRAANRPEGTLGASPLLPPGVSFAESLRGFEDHPFAVNRVYIADAAYRYPIIVDWGTASTLGLLPALFVQQLDFELFASGATDGRGGGSHLAAGSALTLRIALGDVALGLQYQVARRATDDRGWVQLVTLGL